MNFWTSDIAQESNDSRSSQKHSNLESSNIRYFPKKRVNFTKHYVSTAANDNSVSERVNALTNAFMDKGIVAAGTCISHESSPQSSSGVDNVAPVQTVSGRRSLLRHIFRSESSSNAITGSGSGITNGSNKSSAGTEREMIKLAQCRAFTPLEERRITSSQSAFALSSTSSLSTQYDADSSQSYSAERSADCSALKRNWFPGQHQHAVPCLRTFKPGRSANDIVSPEEVQKLNGSNSQYTVNPKPAVKPKPLTLRRERSDLTAGYVPRIATHYTEHNAGSGSDVSARCALMPPSACLDENTLRKCLVELKRKRQEAAAAVSEANSKSRQQQQSQRSHHKERSEIDFDNVNVVLRTRSSDNFRTDQRRLSVPDLADLSHNSLASGVTGVVATAKALTSKLGRNPRTGELQTINEGLVTPVVRRKQYMKDIHANNTGNDWSVGSLLQKPSPTLKKMAKQTEQEHQRHESHDGSEHVFTRKHILIALVPRA
uniref:Non-specific serine/threonine protein kinase n=1 Tax=Elaeophora elaphi TaxID=1147741 RepID=A0A0R3RHJ8_9BILA